MLRKRQEEGQDVPALNRKPNLDSLTSLAFQAWLDLHSTRSQGFSGADPIRYTEIQSYFELNEIWSQETRWFYMQIIAAAEQQIRELQLKQQVKRSTKASRACSAKTKAKDRRSL